MGNAIEVLVIVLPTVTLTAGFAIIMMAMWRRTRLQEMRHRERMAMIERGLTPAPERDPEAFEASIRRQNIGVTPFTTLGVATVAIGLGFVLILGFAAGEPGVAIGVGGAIVLLGIAFVINGVLHSRQMPSPPPRRPASFAGPSEPPGPIGP